MTDEEAGLLRREITKREQGRGKKYPAALRLRAAAWLHAQIAAGTAIRVAAARIGIDHDGTPVVAAAAGGDGAARGAAGQAGGGLTIDLGVFKLAAGPLRQPIDLGVASRGRPTLPIDLGTFQAFDSTPPQPLRERRTCSRRRARIRPNAGHSRRDRDRARTDPLRRAPEMTTD